jgi:hypothetical protein
MAVADETILALMTMISALAASHASLQAPLCTIEHSLRIGPTLGIANLLADLLRDHPWHFTPSSE